jgi:pimeloyl-ACP methyl ester carboxylesterase
MLSSYEDRTSALDCTSDPKTAERPPVLLVPGTGITPEQHWDPTYLPVLEERGHGVCLIRLPDFGARDVQANAEYVASAIRRLWEWSGRKVSVIGHSQGALLPHVALRTWPDLAAYVDDVIGLSGVYDRGSQDVAQRCQEKCLPALHQMAAGSHLLARLSHRRLPTGPSYTNLGVSGDQTVTPQPAANQVPGATALAIQDVCPDHVVPEPQHAMIAGDAVALALVLDALDHPGVASPTRLDPGVCEEGQYPEFDEEAYLSAAGSHESELPAPVAAEPRLYCRYRATCASPRLRGYAVSRLQITVRRHQVILHGNADLDAHIRLVLGPRGFETRLRPGPFELRVARPARKSRLSLATRPRYYRAWAAESQRVVKGRSADPAARRSRPAD